MELRLDVVDGVSLAAVFDQGQMMGLYAQPHDDRSWLGDYFTAQVTRYAPAQRAYFLDIGSGEEAFLPSKEPSLQAGQKIMVRIERPATMDKRVRCSLIDTSDARSLGRIGFGPDVMAQAKQDYPNAQLILSNLEDYDSALIGLLQPKVHVQDGVEIIIEATAALTAIDVNNANPSLSSLDVNRAVTREIARQLRLRNLSGQIVIDYLRLRDPKHRETLLAAVQKHTTFDTHPVQLYGFTKLGLFELTRTSRGLPLGTVFDLVKFRVVSRVIEDVNSA